MQSSNGHLFDNPPFDELRAPAVGRLREFPELLGREKGF
jgi:hypothetical protein